MEIDIAGTGFAELEESLNDIAARWGSTREIVYVVGNTVDYAPIVEFGSDPHPITPNTAEALWFEVDGEIVFANRVEHPGTEPQPYLGPAARATARALDDIAEASNSLEEFMERTALTAERLAKRNAAVDTGTLRADIRSYRDD